MVQVGSSGFGTAGQVIAGGIEGAAQSLIAAGTDITDEEVEVILANLVGGAVTGVITALVGEKIGSVVDAIGKYGFDPAVRRLQKLGLMEELFQIPGFSRVLIKEFWKHPGNNRGFLLEEILTYTRFKSPKWRWVGPKNKFLDYIDDTGKAVDLKTVLNLRSYGYGKIKEILQSKLDAFKKGDFATEGAVSLRIDFGVPGGYDTSGLQAKIQGFFDRWYANTPNIPPDFPIITFTIGELTD